MSPTRACLVGLFVATLGAARPAGAQSAPLDSASRAKIVAFAEDAAVRALRFTKGDLASLRAGEADFTSAGRVAFVKQMDGYLDGNGAPAFTSAFTPAGKPVVIGETNGIVHIKIPGVLVQSSGGSRTTYRVAVEVDAGGAPPKIVRLAQTTCVGAAARNYCM